MVKHRVLTGSEAGSGEPVIEWWLERRDNGKVVLKVRNQGGYSYSVLDIPENGLPQRYRGIKVDGLPWKLESTIMFEDEREDWWSGTKSE
jgi:hypothetical protein